MYFLALYLKQINHRHSHRDRQLRDPAVVLVTAFSGLNTSLEVILIIYFVVTV
jgi:hypothetical protein